VPEILNVEQLADFLGVSVNTIHGLTRQRARIRHANPLPCIAIGKRRFFRRASVESWLAAREQESQVRL
jgi:predicted DNA-binding transcriptional regulator AlpA